MRCWAFLFVVLLALPLASRQSPASSPTPSQKELQAPLALEDGKPTQNPVQEVPPSALRTIGSLSLVLGLVGISLYALKKWGRSRLPGSGGGKLRVEESLALGDRRFVSILNAEGERFLIALGPQGVHLLSRLDGLEEAATGTFDQALQQQTEMARPVPLKDMEAMIKGERP